MFNTGWGVGGGGVQTFRVNGLAINSKQQVQNSRILDPLQSP